jgi:hypothetical protein
MAQQLDAADPMLGQLDVLAVGLQAVPERWLARKVALADKQGGPAVQQQGAFQATQFCCRQVRRLILGQLLQGRPARFQELSDGFALLPRLWFACAAVAFVFG